MILFEQILSSQNLQDAWQRVKHNKGAAGVDGLSIADYSKWIYTHWGSIQTGLEQGYYCPLPVKRIEIPKPNGGIRLLPMTSLLA